MASDLVVGREYHWWRGDPLPELPPLDGFRATVVDDATLLARLHGLDEGAMQARFDEGNYCYVAFLDGTPVGYGWVATQIGRIQEAGLEWPLSDRDRQLWDFATLPAWRGRGVYPHLLQAILRAESGAGERFWIGHRGDNFASQRGIVKAGFHNHLLIVIAPDGQIELRTLGDDARAQADPKLPPAEALLTQIPQEMVAEMRRQFEQDS